LKNHSFKKETINNTIRRSWPCPSRA